MRILIAEDEPSLRENLQFMLEMEGYTVQVAQDGQCALEAAMQAPPDLLITDVMMPRMDGYTLIRQLRENARTAVLPIILLSARSDRTDVRLGMTLGADDYLFKPYQREELLGAVMTRLARHTKLLALQRGLQVGLAAASSQDPVTGLLLREPFEAALQASMDRMPSGHQAAVVSVGLDNFAQINNSLGKTLADRMLHRVAMRLCALFPAPAATDTSANGPFLWGRLGWDTLAMGTCGGTGADALLQHAQRALDGLAEPVSLYEHTVFWGGCAGGAMHDAPGLSAAVLVSRAESALGHAKAMGVGHCKWFDPSDTVQAARSLQIHNGLHHALEHGGFQVVYQPQVCTHSGALVGFEALMRWRQADLGWVSPVEFIPIAEQSKVIMKMGAWVMRAAARQAATWLAQGHTGFRVAVNVSLAQLEGDHLPALVHSVLQETGLPAHYLELEVTESMAMQNVAQTLGNLHACKALGVTLAMDDFGTGYSSLAYLKRFPLEALKIDQSFVRNITEDAGDAAITRAVVAMAQSFGMSVIAEGVETVEQLAFLRKLGCQVIQGYLISKPLPADEAAQCFAGYPQLRDGGHGALG